MVNPRHAPLNPAQLAIWLHEQVADEPTLYVEHACFDLLGEADDDALARAAHRAIAAHPSFGAAIETERGVPSLVLDRFTIEVERRTVSAERLTTLLKVQSISGPTLAGGPLTRCLLVSVSPRRRVLLLVWHHLVADGASLRSFLGTLQDCYTDPGHRPPMDGPTVCDLTRAQLAGAAATRERAEQVARRLAHLPVQPLPRVSERLGPSRCLPLTAGQGALPGLAAAATAARVTTPMLVNAAYQRAVGEVFGLTEFLLGCVTTGRWLPQSQDLVGCFVNTVLLRADGDPATAPARLLRSSARELASALSEQDIPFTAVAGRLLRSVRPRPQYFPQLYLSMDGPHPLELPGLRCHRIRIHHAQAKFAVALIVEYQPDGVQGILHYRSGLLTDAAAHRLMEAFLAQLGWYTAQPRRGRPAAGVPGRALGRGGLG